MSLPGLVALAGLLLQASGVAPPTRASIDLDGDGSSESAQAIVHGKRVRLEVRGARGKKSAAETVPSPGSRNTSVAIESGSLGSAGVLLAVVAAADGKECRSVWRYRNSDLHRLPLRGPAGVLPDCAPQGDWVYRWERANEGAPAVYVREKTRATEGGPLRQREAFAFTGFALDLDPARSTTEIRGIQIPRWQPTVLYHPQALQALTARFDWDPVRSLPRLTITADEARGVFFVRLSDPAGAVECPVIGSETTEANKVGLTVQAGEREASVEIELANGNIPLEARPRGLGERFDHIYAPVTELQGAAIRVFSNADELASAGLRGHWTNDRGESYEVLALPGPGGRIRFGTTEAAAKIDGAPAGTDVLLTPAKGAQAAFALDLRGPNTLDRVPLRCGSGGATGMLCETSGPRERLRRTGARLNVR